MNSRMQRPWTLAAAIATVFLSGLPVVSASVPPVGESGRPLGASVDTALSPAETARYIVRFREAPLALYPGDDARFAAPPQSIRKGRKRLDTQSAAARAYTQHLAGTQTERLLALERTLGRPLAVTRRMQHAINAVVVVLQVDEVEAVRRSEGVAAVERDATRTLATDVGPQFIGAPPLWWGLPSAAQDSFFIDSFEARAGSRGEGVVIGVLDTGFNSLSPSFAATDPSGYTHVNPLGNGVYLGSLCNATPSPCNAKVIGVYDEVASDAAAEDREGHGSHTASTAGGNGRSGTVNGYPARMSGVAPRANLVIFKTCEHNACPLSATTAAVDQAVADGVVDVLSFSISGGTTPWDDSTSLAFLGATGAGIFVAAAAGNTGPSVPVPLPGTSHHHEPWVTSVAAGTHTVGAIGFSMAVNGASAPPDLAVSPAPAGAQLSGPLSGAPIVASPTFGQASDGCTPFAASAFSGKVALLKYGGGPTVGGCGTHAMAGNALAAGATHVLITANTDASFTSGANQPIPVFTTSQTAGGNLHTYLQTHAGATITIAYPARRLPALADSLAGFSLLGPNAYNVLKPDVQAPGVDILAAYNNLTFTTTVNGANVVGLMGGTSMATPHVAGAGALLVALHPDWSPMEIKSALMMTAKEVGLTKPNGTTPSDYFDRGAGRIQVDVASRAGLVLDESALHMAWANPQEGGDGATLNLPSLQDSTCLSDDGGQARCRFNRHVRSTRSNTVTWSLSLDGLPGSVSPSTLVLGPNQGHAVDVTIVATSLPADGTFQFGEVTLTPSDSSLPTLHWPVAVAVPAPRISVPKALSVAIPSGQPSTTAELPVRNTGGPGLNFARLTDGSTATYPWVAQTRTVNYGYYSTKYTDVSYSYFAADDFVLTGSGPVTLNRLQVTGFGVGASLASQPATTPIHWRLYADAAGKPAGNPMGGAAAVWSHDSTLGGAGVTVSGTTVGLNLAVAGAPASLPPGRYWLAVYPELPCAPNANGCTRGWALYQSSEGNGTYGVSINPTAPPPDDQWVAISDQPGFAITVETAAACDALPWLAQAPASGTVGAQQSQLTVLTVSAATLPADAATGYLCIGSNSPPPSTAVVQVNATR
ncbi:S8 family serine peptidase [Tahibacter amnicola]|uniref:S8 family serine peptidase n=1 Tax=Tahibacter amnicola TaxID=2976241 RepID=A0ABY6BJV6_9GAMM|nr:S8 family serine peptidase [Tahibacter amnicola]UXI69886.1 S8 family serine peptidase [Tahibacter amnicola]